MGYPKTNSLRIGEKLEKIISKYYSIEIFKEVAYSFAPLCLIKLEETNTESKFKQMHEEMKNIGFQVKFHLLTKEEFKSYEISSPYKKGVYYSVSFIPKDTRITPKKKKKYTIIQIGLAIITGVMVILSGVFYVVFLEPYYGTLYQSELETYIAIFYFCVGMLAIIVVHEFGHVILSRYHKLDSSHPFLIPGPPPLGMFGAFVSIRDDPQTRNEQFDVAIGGIVFGLLIAFILLVVGFQLSDYVDTDVYIAIRMAQSNRTPEEAANYVKDGLNQYNLIFQGIHYLFFQTPTYGDHYGVILPDKILVLHPLAYAGWMGLLLSGLNLIPISFFDGGYALKALFPTRYIRTIGLLIGMGILISLDFQLFFIGIFGLPGACAELNKETKSYEVPNPTTKLKKSRILLALGLILIFIILYPLTYDNLLYGFGI
jgi:Zn-dependent protease